MIARSGLTTLKYNTASTFIDTLSREIASWVEISITWIRRSTRTISWIKGINSTRPGPLTPPKTPEREDHGALIFPQYLHGRCYQKQGRDQDDRDDRHI